MVCQTLLAAILCLGFSQAPNKVFPDQAMHDVQLNHIYVVLDKVTYEAVKSSDWIRSFACTYEQKNSADEQGGWEGFYIRGKNTYIELFFPQEKFPSIGISGIGMGVDDKGALNILEKKVQSELPDLQKVMFRRDGKPWFEYLAPKDGHFFENHSLWIMEYAPEHFSENSEDVSRLHYNAKRYDAKKPLLDIVGFAIALKPEGIASLSSYLRNFGLSEQNQTYSTPEGVKIELLPEDEHHMGICQLTFALNHYFQDELSYHFGNSILTIHGNRAHWSFQTKECGGIPPHS